MCSILTRRRIVRTGLPRDDGEDGRRSRLALLLGRDCTRAGRAHLLNAFDAVLVNALVAV